jgi:hypothetical protein
MVCPVPGHPGQARRPARLVLTYSQLGLLAEEPHRPGQTLEWAVRCMALFDDVPHPGSGPALASLPCLPISWGSRRWRTADSESPAARRPAPCAIAFTLYRPDTEDTPEEQTNEQPDRHCGASGGAAA